MIMKQTENRWKVLMCTTMNQQAAELKVIRIRQRLKWTRG